MIKCNDGRHSNSDSPNEITKMVLLTLSKTPKILAVSVDFSNYNIYPEAKALGIHQAWSFTGLTTAVT